MQETEAQNSRLNITARDAIQNKDLWNYPGFLSHLSTFMTETNKARFPARSWAHVLLEICARFVDARQVLALWPKQDFFDKHARFRKFAFCGHNKVQIEFGGVGIFFLGGGSLSLLSGNLHVCWNTWIHACWNTFVFVSERRCCCSFTVTEPRIDLHTFPSVASSVQRIHGYNGRYVNVFLCSRWLRCCVLCLWVGGIFFGSCVLNVYM